MNYTTQLVACRSDQKGTGLCWWICVATGEPSRTLCYAFSDVKRCIATGEMAFDLPFFTCNIWLSVGISSHLAYQTTVDLGCIAGIHDLQAI